MSESEGEPSTSSPQAIIDRFPDGGDGNVLLDVTFPPRNEPFSFRQQLETTYRDGLRRGSQASFVDIEGTIVWTQEYLRYRVNGCNHPDATSRVTTQILGGGIAPVCQDFTGTVVTFPPRNEPLLFRNTLEAVYRDQLRRGAVQTFVDAEGDIVWTQEYFRYRVNGCNNQQATDRVLSQVLGGPVQPTCDTPPPPTTPPISSIVTNVSAPGATVMLINTPRPNAGAGPVLSSSGSAAGQVALTASQPVDTIVVSVNTATTSTRLRPAVVLSSYFELKFATAVSTVVVTIQTAPGAVAFTLEFAGSRGGGPFGNYTTSAPGPSASTMTAIIDGQPWIAGPGPAGCRLGALVLSGAFGICGTDGVHQIALGGRAVAGTYPLGTSGSGIESALLIQVSTLGGWGPTRLQGTGQIVITSVSATSISGTFQFTAGPLVPPASGTRSVTNGQFTLPVCAGAEC